MHIPHLDAWLVAAVCCGAIKILSTIVQVAWRGGATELTHSRIGRLLYVAGKVSPIGLVGALLIRAVRSGSSDAVSLTWALAAVCLLVAIVVGLRATGRWYGVMHMLRSKGPDNGA